ncbi:MAG TPA: nitroreductase family deazaflavin-dependent oxidoreductase [Solirubrobacterales bacterium]|nr:nitroreductase family deazaflavin-dependent oxidoreductase [Solirubrobacterales bacterium]
MGKGPTDRHRSPSRGDGASGAPDAGIRDRLAWAGAGLLRARWVVRAPIWLYRAHLGAIFGGRLLMLEHRGRTSGRRRYVVLEVVDHPRPDTYVVVSGFGSRSQWYRNIEADPDVRLWLRSRGPVAAVARPLGAEEAAVALRRYATAHPRAWASLRPVLEQTLGARIEESGTELPMVALRRAS